jgi:hypothetical protein
MLAQYCRRDDEQWPLLSEWHQDILDRFDTVWHMYAPHYHEGFAHTQFLQYGTCLHKVCLLVGSR